eukprot:m.130037 g.130037  ORF g.130037 m.130037 type:complete len:214 (+) comp38010_c0_seq4:82-723(+)
MPPSKKPRMKSTEETAQSPCSNPIGGCDEEEVANGRDSNGSSSEWQNLFQSCGVDMGRSMEAKRKRLESFTQASLKTTNRKVEEVWMRQHKDRQKIQEEYQKQISGIFSQMDSDSEKAKEAEDKLNTLIKQQQKFVQQQHVVHAQRTAALHAVHKQFSKSMEALDKYQEEQQSRVQGELRKEIAQLQRKILHETHHQDMVSARKTLQSMFTQF